jgi:hypothetical protein
MLFRRLRPGGPDWLERRRGVSVRRVMVEEAAHLESWEGVAVERTDWAYWRSVAKSVASALGGC